jgi:N-acetylglucosamine-6-phosphate deacetylase
MVNTPEAETDSASNAELTFVGNIVLPDSIARDWAVVIAGKEIKSVGPRSHVALGSQAQLVDCGDGYIAPGYVDMHVHGGAGADFMDGTRDAFTRVTCAHARHGTTSIVPTSTVASESQILEFLKLARALRNERPRAARVLGAHFYGPYFGPEARGCHPATPLRSPCPAEYEKYLTYADAIVTATVAAELPGAEPFVRQCVARGIRCNVGHSHATFHQMAAAIEWGVRHVDHLYCAMSDRAKLRQTQAYPMRGGVLEATLYFDELTTEVIADGKHLDRELLALALKLKGPDRLAIVTDCNRALDMPEGEYMFGPLDGGEPFLHRDGVGIMPDGQALASGATGMDHAVRTFQKLTGAPLPQVVRMASLTPAQIIGWDDRIGSMQPGKLADILVLDRDLNVRRVFVGGREISLSTT